MIAGMACFAALPGLAFGATCAASDRVPSGYALKQRINYATSACTRQTRKYYSDAATKTYVDVVSCNECLAGTNFITNSHLSPYDCDFTVSWCSSNCSQSMTEPTSMNKGSVLRPNANSCAKSETRYLIYPSISGYFTIESCLQCKSGYRRVLKSAELPCQPAGARLDCERCNPGTFYDAKRNACVSCTVGTYSDTYEATACRACPSASGIYTNEAGTTVASVQNGSITSAAGAASSQQCYLRSGTYYDDMGTFRIEDDASCKYVKKCSVIEHSCLDSNKGMAGPSDVRDGIPTGAPGPYCFCRTEGKYFYFTSMGNTEASCNSGCRSTCTSIISSSSSVRDKLGCD